MTRLMLGSPQFYPTGIDYIEPITVTDGRSRQREMKLFHHVSHRRVIHLKLVESLTAKEVPFKVNQFNTFAASYEYTRSNPLNLMYIQKTKN